MRIPGRGYLTSSVLPALVTENLIDFTKESGDRSISHCGLKPPIFRAEPGNNLGFALILKDERMYRNAQLVQDPWYFPFDVSRVGEIGQYHLRHVRQGRYCFENAATLWFLEIKDDGHDVAAVSKMHPDSIEDSFTFWRETTEDQYGL
jgi:hypothetical protein